MEQPRTACGAEECRVGPSSAGKGWGRHWGAPSPPGTTRSHSALLGTTSRPRLLHAFYFSGISMVVESFKGTPMSAPPLPGTTPVLGTTSRPRLHAFYFSGISMVAESTPMSAPPLPRTLGGLPRFLFYAFYFSGISMESHLKAPQCLPHPFPALLGPTRHSSAPQAVLGCSTLSILVVFQW